MTPRTESSQITALTELVNQLQDRLAEVEQRPLSGQTDPGIIQLENRLSLIESKYSNQSENLSPVGFGQVQKSQDKIKVALPDKFDGNFVNYEPFKASLDNFFALKSSVYSTDEIKVRTVGTLLCKQALQWYSTLLKEESMLLKNFSDFMAEVKRLFSDPNSTMKAQLLIKKLKQGNGSILNYSTKFRSLIIDTGYNQEAQMAAFRSGLSDQIKDILASSLEDPQDLESLISMTIKIDTRLFDRRMELSNSDNGKSASGASGLNALSLVNGKIPKEERLRRIKENLCLYCGGEGHTHSSCPKKKSKLGKSGKTSYGPSSLASVAGNPSGSQQ